MESKKIEVNFESNIKKCPICGKTTRHYMGNFRKDGLCSIHADMLKENKLKYENEKYYILNNDEWQSINEKTIEENKKISFDSKNELLCIICGQETNGYHFCINCYQKYKNKQIVLKITKLSETQMMDEAYDGEYTCNDGHIVKSNAERNIDNYLYEKGIKHAYEPSIAVSKDKNIHPDFVLHSFKGLNNDQEPIDVYIEYFGITNNKRYEETKEYKNKFYTKEHLTVIYLYDEDNKDVNASMNQKLKFFERNKINNYNNK